MSTIDKDSSDPIPVVDEITAQKIEDAGMRHSAESHLLREAAELVASKLQKSEEKAAEREATQETRFRWMCIVLGTMCFLSMISAIYAAMSSDKTRIVVEKVVEKTDVLKVQGDKK